MPFTHKLDLRGSMFFVGWVKRIYSIIINTYPDVAYDINCWHSHKNEQPNNLRQYESHSLEVSLGKNNRKFYGVAEFNLRMLHGQMASISEI